MGEFWRRWHITLGAFMKEYLYIPLGGNRCSRARSLLNNWIVFLVSGIWHGASWNFVIWGAWHGIWIVFAKLFRTPQGGMQNAECRMRNAECRMKNGGAKHLLSVIRYPLSVIRPARLAGAAWTFLMVMLGWVFFAAADFRSAAAYFRSLAGCASGGASLLALVTPQVICATAVGTLLSFLPAIAPKFGIADWRLETNARNAAVWSRTLATALLLLLATLPLFTSGFSPFIYNRF
jgi:alginate O-acetyltransferase complex protein AlgI